MRKAGQQQAILGAGRLGFGPVDDHRPDAPAHGYRPQLAGGGEVRAAPSAQAALLDLLNQLCRSDARQRAVDPHVRGQRHRLAPGLQSREQPGQAGVTAAGHPPLPTGLPDKVPVTVFAELSI